MKIRWLPLSSRLKFRDSMHSSQDGMKIISRYRARVNAIIKRPSTNASTEYVHFVSLQYYCSTSRKIAKSLNGPMAHPQDPCLLPAADSRQAPPPPNEHKAVGSGGWRRTRTNINLHALYIHVYEYPNGHGGKPNGDRGGGGTK